MERRVPLGEHGTVHGRAGGVLRVGTGVPQREPGTERGGTVSELSADQVEKWSRHLLHISQHKSMIIALAGRIQGVADEMRAAAGLPGSMVGDVVTYVLLQFGFHCGGKAVSF